MMIRSENPGLSLKEARQLPSDDHDYLNPDRMDRWVGISIALAAIVMALVDAHGMGWL